MKTFDTFYKFWDLHLDDQYAIVGKSFKTKNREDLYFPVCLADRYENYGYEIGLIIVLDIRKAYKSDGYWFKYGVASPDDDDRQVDLTGHHLTKYRKIVIEYMKSLPDTIKHPTSISDLLKNITVEIKPYLKEDVKLDHSYAFPKWNFSS